MTRPAIISLSTNLELSPHAALLAANTVHDYRHVLEFLAEFFLKRITIMAENYASKRHMITR